MIRIFVVGDSYSHFKEPIETYVTRLWRDIEIVKIQPEGSEDPKLIVRKETERIVKILEKYKSTPIYLDIVAKEYSTTELFLEMEQCRNRSEQVDFLLGGAYGVDPEMIPKISKKTISLSRLTLPHSLAFLVLLEQIYRTEQIRRNSWYHH